MKFVLASHNKHKISELQRLLSVYLPDVEVLSLSDAGVDGEIIEDGNSFEENALIKARFAAKSGYIGVGDDSGLCVDALDGAPGIYSARYAGEGADDAANNKKLLSELEGQSNRAAKFVCAFACVFPDGREPIVVRGETAGEILCAPRGEAGFGYDPLFWIDEDGKTYAEMSADDKNAISHRGRAIAAFAKLYADAEFAENDKNDVAARGQLQPSQFVFTYGEGAGGKRFLFVGNSTLRHGIKTDIGWYGDYGMAASSEDKDYLHLTMARILKKEPDAVFGVAQVAEWEVNYKNGHEKLHLYEKAREFAADVIIMRCIENCPVKDGFDPKAFYEGYSELIDYLNLTGKAKVLLTTGFWKHKMDYIIREIGRERGYPVVEMGELGALDEMKAIGLFEHRGVANHPGDKGMKAISDLISDALGY